MLPKQPQTEVPVSPPPPGSSRSPAPASAPAPQGAIVRNASCLGPGLKIKGEVVGDENLQIEGDVEGAIILPGKKLTVGRTGQLKCNIEAREVLVYGSIVGNLRVTEVVEIKKDGSVIGDIRAARVSIQDGAYFKGYINMDDAPLPIPAALRTPILPIDGPAN
jgi:cytoskeletal protein CcmA (bactofilin family)